MVLAASARRRATKPGPPGQHRTKTLSRASSPRAPSPAVFCLPAAGIVAAGRSARLGASRRPADWDHATDVLPQGEGLRAAPTAACPRVSVVGRGCSGIADRSTLGLGPAVLADDRLGPMAATSAPWCSPLDQGWADPRFPVPSALRRLIRFRPEFRITRAMKKTRYSEAQIASALRQAEAGTPVEDHRPQAGSEPGHLLSLEGAVHRQRHRPAAPARTAGGGEQAVPPAVADPRLDRNTIQDVLSKSARALRGGVRWPPSCCGGISSASGGPPPCPGRAPIHPWP